MTQQDVISILKETGGMLEGHFLLTSGRHSDRYMQCARLFEYPQHSQSICSYIASKVKDKVDVVIGPALGGVIISYEMGRQLGARNLFAEREDDCMKLRRGFSIPSGSRVLVVEDVITTGGTVREVIDLVRDLGAEVVGVAVVVDRSNGKIDFGVPLYSALTMEVISYEAADCPLCKTVMPLVKPGSRVIK